ncbi:Histidine kinase-, DNA gyrase B-, and HSP90-like ATPase [Paraburkholderia steynii]|uniref:Histidine kinase-, DNA gyrase B-, and HSP90-like ATPase n=1 Tax=Paraburkholderia steynii TaxID=1245441 RepID=A0A7Z7FQT6_9BURK|nr:STAS-like domain-containing protein [Paraburkholderia steynii]SDJ54227.1 Histidine kinase-, DNA gyrase B-, and HSP90-like ATPase [Paraburkholderia steynii]
MEEVKEWEYQESNLSAAVSLIDTLNNNFDIERTLLSEIYAAATELISNIIHHAYPINFQRGSNCECRIAIAVVDESIAQISIVDYGVTIPKSIFDKISPDTRRELFSDSDADSKLIEAAASGHSVINQPGRGLGIASIVETTKRGTFQSLRIKSRHGSVAYSQKEDRFSRDQTAIFQGTSIEISFQYISRKRTRTQHVEISIAKDFSPFPAGRFINDGPHSGEAFSNQIAESLDKADIVTIDLDGTYGLADSFLEAAFGGLVRRGITASELESRLNIISQNEIYAIRILQYIRDAGKKNG